MPGSPGNASRAAKAAVESNESDTLATNDSSIVLDAPLWHHWPGSLSFGLTSSVLCGCSCQRACPLACLPAYLPSLDQCCCVSILHAGNAAGLERVSLPACLLTIYPTGHSLGRAFNSWRMLVLLVSRGEYGVGARLWPHLHHFVPFSSFCALHLSCGITPAVRLIELQHQTLQLGGCRDDFAVRRRRQSHLVSRLLQHQHKAK